MIVETLLRGASRMLASETVDEEKSIFWVIIQALTALFVMIAAFSLAFMLRSGGNANILSPRQYQAI